MTPFPPRAPVQEEAKDYQWRAEIAESRVQAYEATERDLRFESRDLQKQLALAEASSNNAQQELKTAREELAAARAGERKARDEAAELRGQLKSKALSDEATPTLPHSMLSAARNQESPTSRCVFRHK